MSYNVPLNFLKVNVSLPDSVAPAVPASHWPHSHLRVRRSALHWSLRQPSLRMGRLPSTHACKAPMPPWAVAGTHFDVKQGDISHEGQGTASSYELNHIVRAMELPQALTLVLEEQPREAQSCCNLHVPAEHGGLDGPASRPWGLLPPPFTVIIPWPVVTNLIEADSTYKNVVHI